MLSVDFFGGDGSSNGIKVIPSAYSSSAGAHASHMDDYGLLMHD